MSCTCTAHRAQNQDELGGIPIRYAAAASSAHSWGKAVVHRRKDTFHVLIGVVIGALVTGLAIPLLADGSDETGVQTAAVAPGAGTEQTGAAGPAADAAPAATSTTLTGGQGAGGRTAASAPTGGGGVGAPGAAGGVGPTAAPAAPTGRQ